MYHTLHPLIAVPIIVLALAFAAGVWYFLLRAVPDQRATGVITERVLQEQVEVRKKTPRAARSLERYSHETKYTLPDRYLYTIRLDGEGPELRYWQAVVEGLMPEVGDRVEVVYQSRSIPLFGRRHYVSSLARLNENP